MGGGFPALINPITSGQILFDNPPGSGNFQLGILYCTANSATPGDVLNYGLRIYPIDLTTSALTSYFGPINLGTYTALSPASGTTLYLGSLPETGGYQYGSEFLPARIAINAAYNNMIVLGPAWDSLGAYIVQVVNLYDYTVTHTTRVVCRKLIQCAITANSLIPCYWDRVAKSVNNATVFTHLDTNDFVWGLQLQLTDSSYKPVWDFDPLTYVPGMLPNLCSCNPKATGRDDRRVAYSIASNLFFLPISGGNSVDASGFISIQNILGAYPFPPIYPWDNIKFNAHASVSMAFTIRDADSGVEAFRLIESMNGDTNFVDDPASYVSGYGIPIPGTVVGVNDIATYRGYDSSSIAAYHSFWNFPMTFPLAQYNAGWAESGGSHNSIFAGGSGAVAFPVNATSDISIDPTTGLGVYNPHDLSAAAGPLIGGAHYSSVTLGIVNGQNGGIGGISTTANAGGGNPRGPIPISGCADALGNFFCTVAYPYIYLRGGPDAAIYADNHQKGPGWATFLGGGSYAGRSTFDYVQCHIPENRYRTFLKKFCAPGSPGNPGPGWTVLTQEVGQSFTGASLTATSTYNFTPVQFTLGPPQPVLEQEWALAALAPNTALAPYQFSDLIFRLADVRDTLDKESRPVLQVFSNSGFPAAPITQVELQDTTMLGTSNQYRYDARSYRAPQMRCGVDISAPGYSNDAGTVAPFVEVLLYQGDRTITGVPFTTRLVTIVFGGSDLTSPTVSVASNTGPASFDKLSIGPGSRVYYQNSPGEISVGGY